MTVSENNRRARVYTLTPVGRKRLETETENWEQLVLSIRRILRTT
jgi:DNA-binding MarR family transcriptional regulator